MDSRSEDAGIGPATGGGKCPAAESRRRSEMRNFQTGPPSLFMALQSSGQFVRAPGSAMEVSRPRGTRLPRALWSGISLSRTMRDSRRFISLCRVSRGSLSPRMSKVRPPASAVPADAVRKNSRVEGAAAVPKHLSSGSFY